MIEDIPKYGDVIIEEGRATLEFHNFFEDVFLNLNAPRLPEYTVSTVPSAVGRQNYLISVSDETGGKTVAFSDGTDWRRVQDRAIIS